MAGIFLAYSLLASTLLIVVWAVYKCVLANTGCFRFNRILLLSCITLAFVAPIFILNPFWVADIMENNIEIAFNPVEVTYIANTVSEQITPIWDYIVTLYLIGVIVMILYFLVSLVRLALFILKGEHVKQDDCRIILHRHNSVAPFAWCGYIMMPRRDWYEFGQMIVCHEKAHIKCRHWIDLLFMQAAIIITWYCPAIWLLRNELHTLHEYEADSRVLASGVKREEYQIFLIKKTVGARFATLSNCLNHSSLKKRIAMMLKQKSSPWARLKYLYVLPLAALTVVAFARPEISHELEKISSVKISEIIPVQEKKEPKRNVEVETLARDSVVSEKDMQAIQEKVSAVMEKYQPEIDKAVEEAVKAANIDEIVSAEMAKHQAEIDKAVQAAIEAAKINETIAAEMEKIQPEINRAIEEP